MRQHKEKSYANALGGPGMHLLHTKVAVFRPELRDVLAIFRLEHRDGIGKIEDADLLAPGDGHACKALWVAGAGGLRRRDRDSARHPKQNG